MKKAPLKGRSDQVLHGVSSHVDAHFCSKKRTDGTREQSVLVNLAARRRWRSFTLVIPVHVVLRFHRL